MAHAKLERHTNKLLISVIVLALVSALLLNLGATVLLDQAAVLMVPTFGPLIWCKGFENVIILRQPSSLTSVMLESYDTFMEYFTCRMFKFLCGCCLKLQ